MRFALIALTSLGFAALLPAPSASAATVHPWCAFTQDGRTSCAFFSFQQCLAASDRPAGGCVANPEHPLARAFGMAGTPEGLLIDKGEAAFPETVGSAPPAMPR